MNIAPHLPVPRLVEGEIAEGCILGRYELLLPIATGGMAMVWAARVKGTRGFQKIVAVKTMLSKLSEDAQFEQMFLDEASLASQIRHPNVVQISDLGEQNGVLYLAMEWIDGIALNSLMKAAKAEGGVPLPIAVRIVMNACAGLHAAHELRDNKGELVGLVHRDVSPQNILVSYDGVCKVVDFGVAKATAMGGGATAAGQLKGKVSYMSPEQVRGEAIDRRSDVFAMGIVLYGLTTGKHPFRRESEAATLYNIASDDPVVAPRKFLPDYPEKLEAVVLKALAKTSSNRYASASDMQRALDQCFSGADRANTDEDIAAFMARLFAKKREASRLALKEALDFADRQSARLIEPSTSSVESQVTSLSNVTSSVAVRAADLSLETTRTALDLPTAPPRRRPTVWLASAAAGVVLALCAVAYLARSTGDRTPGRTAEAPSALATEKAPPPARTVVDIPPVQVVAESPPSPDPAASGPTGESARIVSGTQKPAYPRSSPNAGSGQSKPSKPPLPKWRQDPGF